MTETMAETACCKNCRFFRKDKIGNDGECVAVPATPIMVGVNKDIAGNFTPQIGTFFPRMKSVGWCGYYKTDPKFLEP